MIVDTIVSMLHNISKKSDFFSNDIYKKNDCVSNDILYGSYVNFTIEELLEERVLNLDTEYNEIHTTRLILQSVTTDDFKLNGVLQQEEESYDYLGFGHDETYYKYNSVRRDSSQILHFAMFLKSIEQWIGEVEVKWEKEHKKAQIGYRVSSSFENNGYATEAVKSMIEFAFFILGVNRVEAYHYEGNIASKKVLIKAGMNFEGCSYEAVRVGGKARDLYRYSILKKQRITE